MHEVSETDYRVTKCGVIMRGWSVAYFQEPIPQILCLICKGR